MGILQYVEDIKKLEIMQKYFPGYFEEKKEKKKKKERVKYFLPKSLK